MDRLAGAAICCLLGGAAQKASSQKANAGRGSVPGIFGNEGRLSMPMGVIVPQDNLSLEVFAKGGAAKINSLQVHELKSAWPSR